MSGISFEVRGLNEVAFRVVRNTDSGKRYLQHIGHAHLWTADQSLAMEYSKREIAQALADKMGGKLEAI